MEAFNSSRARRAAFASVVAASVAVASVAVSAQPAPTTTIDGIVASQPSAPVKIQTCTAAVTGTTFVPAIVFEATTVKTSAVTYAFFNKANAPLGHVSLSAPYGTNMLPTGTTTFTCAIDREELADGTVFPTAASHGSTALVVGGVIGVGLIAALAGHGSSGSTPAQPATALPTATPSPRPSATPSAAVTVTPSPVVTVTASAAPTASATPSPVGQTPSPSPVPTATPSPAPTTTSTAGPTASPTPTPSPVGALAINPNSLTFTTNGSSQTATIAESGGGNAPFRLSSTTCAMGGKVDGGAIATVTPTSNIANPTMLSVTSKEAGNCTFTFVDAAGNAAQLAISVTTSSVIVNGRRGQSPRSTPAPRAFSAPPRVR